MTKKINWVFQLINLIDSCCYENWWQTCGRFVTTGSYYMRGKLFILLCWRLSIPTLNFEGFHGKYCASKMDYFKQALWSCRTYSLWRVVKVFVFSNANLGKFIQSTWDVHCNKNTCTFEKTKHMARFLNQLLHEEEKKYGVWLVNLYEHVASKNWKQ